MSEPLRSVNLDEAARGVYIDFEGGGSVRRSFLGILWQDDDGDTAYRIDLLDTVLWPLADIDHDPYRQHFACADLTDTLQGLKTRAEVENRLVFAYSEYESRAIEEHLGDCSLNDWWQENLVDGLKVAKRWKTSENKKRKEQHKEQIVFPPKEGQTKQNHSLQNFLRLIDYHVPTDYSVGVVATALDLVRTELQSTTEATLSDEAAHAWEQAVMHNLHDCLGLRKLMIRCGTDKPRVPEKDQSAIDELKRLLDGS